MNTECGGRAGTAAACEEAGLPVRALEGGRVPEAIFSSQLRHRDPEHSSVVRRPNG